MKTINVPTVIHVHSNYSGGKYSVENIAAIAKNNNVKAVILTDKIGREWEYGIRPFDQIIKLQIKDKSIEPAKLGNYLKEIRSVNDSNEDVTIIPGLEIAPHYSWEGSFLDENIKIKDWDKELLVLGLKNDKQWTDIPYISNPFSKNYVYQSITSITLLLLILALSIYLFLKRKNMKIMLGKYSNSAIYCSVFPYRKLSVILFFISLLCICSCLPIKSNEFSKYKSYKTEPYQKVIDYAGEKSGVAIWSHPETHYDKTYNYGDGLFNVAGIINPVKRKMKVHAVGKPYSEMLSLTNGFTAFSALYEGYDKIARPGGIWDRDLLDYVNGKRKDIYWAVGEADYYGNESNKNFSDVQTVFIAKSNNENDIVDALKKGSMYVLMAQGNKGLIVDDFYIHDDALKAFSGQILNSNGDISLVTSICSYPEPEVNIKLKIIKNGKVIKIIDDVTPVNLSVDFKSKDINDSYFRIEIDSNSGIKIISNPIFVFSI